MDLPPGKLEFLFDYLSPYAYIAWTQIHELARRHEFTIEPVPVLLAGILNATGQKGPAEIPSERAYLMRDLSRTARARGIPLDLPPTHPFNPLLSLRLAAAIDDRRTRITVVTKTFELAWVEGKDITSAETLAQGLSSIGLDPAPLVAAAQTTAAKNRLRANTDAAIAGGVFGVPMIRVGNEMFWGYESFDNLARYLAGEEDYDPDLVERWMQLKPSASRMHN